MVFSRTSLVFSSNTIRPSACTGFTPLYAAASSARNHCLDVSVDQQLAGRADLKQVGFLLVANQLVEQSVTGDSSSQFLSASCSNYTSSSLSRSAGSTKLSLMVSTSETVSARRLWMPGRCCCLPCFLAGWQNRWYREDDSRRNHWEYDFADSMSTLPSAD